MPLEEHLVIKQLLANGNFLSEDDIQAFSSVLQPFNAKRRELLTSRDTTEKYLYIILSGSQRIYSIDKQGRESTLVFTYAPSFGGMIDSFLGQHPSLFYYETLTASSFLRISHNELLALAQERPAIYSFMLHGIGQAFTGILTRMMELQNATSEERFRLLLERSPHILQLVPQKYLAGYLGMDPTNFSKLINRIRL